MVSNEHIKQLKENNLNLLKQSTQLHAQVEYYKKDLEDFKKKTHQKLEKTIRYYDDCNLSVLEYLIDNNMIKRGDNHHKRILSLFPMKLG